MQPLLLVWKTSSSALSLSSLVSSSPRNLLLVVKSPRNLDLFCVLCVQAECQPTVSCDESAETRIIIIINEGIFTLSFGER